MLRKLRFFTGTHTWLALRTPGAYIAERASGRFVAGDFDHDGKDDLAALYEYNNSAMQIHVMKSSGSAFTKLPSWKIYSAGSYDASRIIGLVTAGDTNGDGKDDITALYRYNNGLRSPHRFISTGTSF